MKKISRAQGASSVLEVALLLGFVALIAIGSMTMYNSQKSKLAQYSQTNLNSKASVNLNKLSAAGAKDTVNYNKVETAGTSALTYLASKGITAEEFESALSSVTYGDLQSSVAASAASGQPDIFQLANSLNSSMNLGYQPVSSDSVNLNTLSTMVGVFNAATSVNTGSSKPVADAFVSQVGSLVQAYVK